jgi:hypothetical protein
LLACSKISSLAGSPSSCRSRRWWSPLFPAGRHAPPPEFDTDLVV